MKNMLSSEVLHAFSQILDGVEAAHLSGVWHRDLKPENVLWDIGDNKLAIADFGIAHFEEDAIYTAVETKNASRMANFQYSAPEQRVRGVQVDNRADIFSLGLILNELFTGEIPQGTGYKRIEDIDAAYSYLDDLVDSMIQQNPENRTTSISELKKELIGHKNKFIALQRYNELKSEVIRETEPEEFKPITITAFDYDDGVLMLWLSDNVPSRWAQVFQNPRYGYSSVVGYGPQSFQIHGNKASITNVHDNADFIQRIIDNAKNYVSAANSAYVEYLREQAVKEEHRKRAELEQKVAKAELKKNILAQVKL